MVIQELSILLQEEKQLDAQTYLKWHPAGKYREHLSKRANLVSTEKLISKYSDTQIPYKAQHSDDEFTHCSVVPVIICFYYLVSIYSSFTLKSINNILPNKVDICH